MVRKYFRAYGISKGVNITILMRFPFPAKFSMPVSYLWRKAQLACAIREESAFSYTRKTSQWRQIKALLTATATATKPSKFFKTSSAMSLFKATGNPILPSLRLRCSRSSTRSNQNGANAILTLGSRNLMAKLSHLTAYKKLGCNLKAPSKDLAYKNRRLTG